MNDFTAQRKTMVDCQVRPYDVTDLSIIDAMLEIPREKFVASSMRSLAYMDEDLPLGIVGSDWPRSLMEPASFARLIQLADIREDSFVLDVGCATGYSTAVLSRLCSSVVAVEEDAKLLSFASEILTELEIGNAVVVEGNLANGFEKEGPYDVIFVGGATGQISEYLLRQLKDGGKLVTVEGAGKSGSAVSYVRNGDTFSSVSHFNCAVDALPGFEKQVEFEF